MPDTQIHPTGTVSTPADYVIPTGAELILKGAYAHFDGTSAAGSFVPLLRIISNAGSVSLEAVADTTIAAGASADVTWFPRVAGTGSGGAATSGAVAYLTGDTGAIASGASARVGFTSFHATDTTVFGTSTLTGQSPPFHNAAGDTYLYGTAKGFYLAFAMTAWASGLAITAVLSDDGLQWDLNVVGAANQPSEIVPNKSVSGGSIGPASVRMFYVDASDTPMTTSINCQNGDTASHQVTGATLAVHYIGTPTGLLNSVF